MHPRFFADQAAAHPAIGMAATGETVSYAGLEAAVNRGAQLFRALGIGVGETVAVWLGNCREYFEIYWAAQRAGLYLCPISSHLTAEEAAYILNDSGSRLLVTHKDVPGAASLGAALLPGVAHRYDLDSWR